MARGDAGIHGETCLSLDREGCSNKEEGWKSMTIYQESLQDNKPLHSITFRITQYAQEPTLLSKWSLLRHLDRQSRTTLRAVFRVVLAPWHIRSEKSMDFANGSAKESAQAQLLGISKQRVY